MNFVPGVYLKKVIRVVIFATGNETFLERMVAAIIARREDVDVSGCAQPHTMWSSEHRTLYKIKLQLLPRGSELPDQGVNRDPQREYDYAVDLRETAAEYLDYLPPVDRIIAEVEGHEFTDLGCGVPERVWEFFTPHSNGVPYLSIWGVPLRMSWLNFQRSPAHAQLLGLMGSLWHGVKFERVEDKFEDLARTSRRKLQWSDLSM